MAESKNFQCITEGGSNVLVLKKKISKKGPGSKDKEPFYNPSMELNRDLSIIIAQWMINHSKKPINILDGLAASGIRGIRFANELDGDFKITINDFNEKAYELIKKNIKHSNLENVNSLNENLNTLLSKKKFDYIDIDPFGSPIYFIDSAIRSIRNNGIVACTATDTATLCGVYPKVCLRRYSAQPFHSYLMHEIGLRILLGVVAREAGKYDRGIEPLVCYSTDHYFRFYVKIKYGVESGNDSIKNVKMVNLKELGFSSKNKDIGPLWMGEIQNKETIIELRTILFNKKINSKNILWKLLDLLEEESDAPAFFYTTEDLSSSFKKPVPRLKDVFDNLRKDGFSAYRTHFNPIGFKTNARREQIIRRFF